MNAKRKIVLPEAPPLKDASPIAAAKKPEDKAKTSFTPGEINRPPETAENRVPPAPEPGEYRKFGPKQQQNQHQSHQSSIEARDSLNQSQPQSITGQTEQDTNFSPPSISTPKPNGNTQAKRDRLLSLCAFVVSAIIYISANFYNTVLRESGLSPMSSKDDPRNQNPPKVSETDNPVNAPLLNPLVVRYPPIEDAPVARPTAPSTEDQKVESYSFKTKQQTTAEQQAKPPPKPLTKAKVLKDWIELAEQGDVYAQSQLGHMYATGQGAPRNYDEALRWNFMAAKAGSARAQSNLGVAYGNGQGVSSDAIEAYAWWYVAASNGNSAARSNMKKFDAHRTLTDQQKARAIARAGVLSGTLRN
jgi:hypothetical protein